MIKLIKDKIEDIADDIKKDPELLKLFKTEPVKVVEELVGMDLPDELIEKIADLAGTHRAEVLRRNLICFNTRKHSNERVFYNVDVLEEAILTNRKAKAVMAAEDFSQSTRRLESEIDRVFRELQVPDDAKEVDVVQLTYRWKNGTVKISTTGSETTPYTNVSLRVFRREDVLCLADLENRYELPIAAMRRLKMVKKPLVIQGWNKEERLNDPFYKPYKLTMDNYERVHTKSYGLLELNHDGVDWALWLPPYELNYISALTGLPITEE